MRNKILFGVFTIILILGLGYINYFRFFYMAGDSAGYVDLIIRASQHYDLRSRVFASAYPIVDLMGHSYSYYCSNDLLSKYENWSFLKWHQYGIAYIFGVIVNITHLDPLIFSALINSAAVITTFIYLNKVLGVNKFSILDKILLNFVFITFPPLLGSISGQYYFERLFIPFSLAIYWMIMYSNFKYRKYLTYTLVILCASATERSSLLIGVFILFLITIHKEKLDWKLFFLSIFCILNYVFWKNYIQDSFYNNSTSLDTILNNISNLFNFNAPITIQAVRLLIFLLPYFLISIFNFRYFILSIFFVLPNFLITVGGAEKTIFVTHYHSLYISILLISLIQGFVVFKKLEIKNNIIKITILILIAWNSFYLFRNNQVVSAGLYHNFAKESYSILTGQDLKINTINKINEFNKLFEGLDRVDFISAAEFSQPILVSLGFKNIRYLPIGIGHSKYLLTEEPSDAGVIQYHIYAMSPHDLTNLEQCLTNRIHDGYSENKILKINGVTYKLWIKNN